MDIDLIEDSIANFFSQKIADEQGGAQKTFSKEALEKLNNYPWTVNVRELRNVIERILILGEGTGPIEPAELPNPGEGGGDSGEMTLTGSLATLPLREARELFERQYLMTQINRFGGNISRTAAFVGMERSALHRKLKSLGVVTSAKSGSRVARVEEET